MKKKLLSLVLAGAMVASTSVSAFADTEYTIGSNGQQHQVTITGDVANTNNETVPGTITVTVPTAMAFSIDKKGVVAGGEITVVNRSDERVEVVAKQFTDSTPSTGIVLVKESELDTKIDENNADKRHVSLKLTGNGGSVGLVSGKTGSETGFVDEQGNKVPDSANTSLGSAWKDNDLKLSLSGRAKKSTGQEYNAPDAAVQDTFSLVLKIQKTK